MVVILAETENCQKQNNKNSNNSNIINSNNDNDNSINNNNNKIWSQSHGRRGSSAKGDNLPTGNHTSSGLGV